MSHFRPLLFAQLLTTAFLAVLFLQSGFDKVFDWNGNKQYLTEHFKNSPLKGLVGLMFPVITVLEVLTGVTCAIGVLLLPFRQLPSVAFIGATLSALSILSLFFGQRVAKDYGGASGLVPYFILSIGAMLLLTLSPWSSGRLPI
jgi:uncharacterized membrane protein YphA (DoxX/SURF4 family)